MTVHEPGEDDEELRLVRASQRLLADLEHAIPLLLWRGSSEHQSLRRHVRVRDLDKVVQLVEPFQGDPQLLDTRLKQFLEPISRALTASLSFQHEDVVPAGKIPILTALSELVYVFCKVRGEKIIARFFNNEPKFVSPVLVCLESKTRLQVPQWQVIYLLELWLSHLLLAPFSLSLFDGDSKGAIDLPGLTLPSVVPNIAKRVLSVGLQHLSSFSKQQDTAAKLLTRLASRPDMAQIQLGGILIDWASEQISKESTPSGLITGALNLLSRLAKSLDTNDSYAGLARIYHNVRNLADRGELLQSSTIDHKTFVKILKSIGKATADPGRFSDAQAQAEASDDLEDILDRLLTSLSDRDTLIRLAASKALGVVVVCQPAEYRLQVVETVIQQLRDNLTHAESQRYTSIGADSTAETHGLTLTLAFCLSTRSVAVEHLSEVMSALFGALAYERRGPAGQSLAGNVRDAACFGLWSLARRYTTTELSSVPRTFTRQSSGSDRSTVQLMADNLLVSACLDNEGNVRRGTSAALQELVGRHPNEVAHGIALIQIVDYQAVGLRRRAMIDVAQAASMLNPGYWTVLTTGLLGWRGIMAADVASRDAAATALGKLSADRALDNSHAILDKLQRLLGSELVDDRHGALLATASIIDCQMSRTGSSGTLESKHCQELQPLFRFLSIFESQEKWITYTPGSLRAEHPVGVARLLISSLDLLARCNSSDMMPSRDTFEVLKTIATSLFQRSDESILAVVPDLAQALLRLRSKLPTLPNSLIDLPPLVRRLEHDSKEPTLRSAGCALMLGASIPFLGPDDPSREDVVAQLANLQSACIIEWRVMGLRALQNVVRDAEGMAASPSSAAIRDHDLQVMSRAIRSGLNDYTITERGDVGSLVRLQAIACVDSLWSSSFERQLASLGEAVLLEHELQRLSLERLDRTRLAAARCRRLRSKQEAELQLADVSSAEYCQSVLAPLGEPHCDPELATALVRGCISCASMGSERLVQAARSALSAVIFAHPNPSVVTNFLTVLGALLKEHVLSGADTLPALNLLSFVLDCVDVNHIDQSFNWRALLSTVQKAHFKSSIIPRLLAAIDVYRGLGPVPDIRAEVTKKLISMLKMNPFPRVRVAAAESLWVLTECEALLAVDWGRAKEDVALSAQDVAESCLP